jgi:hypothetical protein
MRARGREGGREREGEREERERDERMSDRTHNNSNEVCGTWLQDIYRMIYIYIYIYHSPDVMRNMVTRARSKTEVCRAWLIYIYIHTYIHIYIYIYYSLACGNAEHGYKSAVENGEVLGVGGAVEGDGHDGVCDIYIYIYQN